MVYHYELTNIETDNCPGCGALYQLDEDRYDHGGIFFLDSCTTCKMKFVVETELILKPRIHKEGEKSDG